MRETATMTGTATWHHLRDGTAVHVRPVRPGDGAGIAAAFEHLSERSRWTRFGTAKKNLSTGELRYLTHLDQYDHAAYLAETSARGLGIARYVRAGGEPGSAELAVTVVDDHQRRGLGTLLLHRLAEHAEHHGVERFVADVLPENTASLRMLERLAPWATRRFEDGYVRVDLPLQPPG